MGVVGRPRKIKTAAEMIRLWEQYKVECDSQSVLTHEFSQKRGEFVSAELKRKVSYTIEGFCVFLKLPRSSFYATYAENEQFRDVVTRMREECEADVRGKFETGQIPPQLAALWMSKFGYGANANVKVDAEELVNDWINGVLANDDKS